MTPGACLPVGRGQMFIGKDKRKKYTTPAGVEQRCFQLFVYTYVIPAYRQAGRDI
jgi:hypothetical protein